MPAGRCGGVALRVRDKANYLVVPFFWYVAVYRVVDGQLSRSSVAYVNVHLTDTEAEQWHIKVAGSDLDVWVNVDNASAAAHTGKAAAPEWLDM